MAPNKYKRRRLIDVTARRTITGGGLLIIVSIIAMLAFLVAETVPLWGSASVEPVETELPTAPDSDRIPVFSTNEYREVFFAVDAEGVAHVWTREDGAAYEMLAPTRLPLPDSQRIVEATPSSPEGDEWYAALESGALLPIRMSDGQYFDGPTRRYRAEVTISEPIEFAIDSLSNHTVSVIAAMRLEEGAMAAALFEDGAIHFAHREESMNFLDELVIEDEAQKLDLPKNAVARSLCFAEGGKLLFVGTESGQILEYELGSDPEITGSYQALDEPIVHLSTLLGGNSIVIGGDRGTMEVWFRARPEGTKLNLIRSHSLEPHTDGIAGAVASTRNRLLLSWDRSGEARLHFVTTERSRKTLRVGPAAPETMVLSPKVDGIFAIDSQGKITGWDLDDPHSDVSVQSLFGKVHYEGFAKPEYSWQSTGATDETEPKLSLVPLVFGSIKGTLYAMALSAPLAILAAIYTALFMRPWLRAIVKPVMELMATIPSVVLGLLAGIWLAPRLQHGMPVILIAGAFIAGSVLLVGWLRSILPGSISRKLTPGTEVVLLIPVAALALFVIFGLNTSLDGLFPGGFIDWMYQNLGIRYDQRNALIVGIAMGLAVIPIVFSVSEDSLSSVPRHLTAGSLALGATPWQTAWRVILPAASPGIFSALMIGFGRAVGETMIMLMATGNTPIMDWSLFNGFRTLSANIAVEIPEAPHGGSLYRILFLSALLLFGFTLLVNTTAEFVSTRLRKRYSRY